MEAHEKVEILQEVYDIEELFDSTYTEPEVLESLQKFTKDVLHDQLGQWDSEDKFIDILLDNFSDDHILWQYISF